MFQKGRRGVPGSSFQDPKGRVGLACSLKGVERMAEQPKTMPFSRWSTAALIAVVMVSFWLAQRSFVGAPAPEHIPYSDFLELLEEDKIAEVQIEEDRIRARLGPEEAEEKRVIVTRLPNVDDSKLIEDLRKKGVEFSGKQQQQSWWGPLLLSGLFPLLLLVGLVFMMRRAAMSQGGGALSFGKNRAKIYDASQQNKVTFDDVAGIDEVLDELREVVDFLKRPERYRALGARIPKGVLLVGAPGTGKTLVARAVAGEASVPFFSMSGSDFVEMFVGVGASRVRDLFEQAKRRAPCIIFIDEIDAIGRSRGGVGSMATHDEREQTLNQLLSEMDGFDTTSGVVIMAATNRPEVLDQALVRSGRFDRQVVVDRPDINGRLAILKVHARDIRLGETADLQVIARRTPGMVGADLAKVLNEAALAAVRAGREEVQQEQLEEAVDRIQLGLRKRGRAMTEGEQHRVALHESGHTLVAFSMEHADPVHRVTIIPRSVGSLGATLQLPAEEHYLMTDAELRDRVCVMLGGRAAEELVLGNISTGAQNDLEKATETVRQMICQFGMSDKLGPQTLGRVSHSRFLDIGPSVERNFSERTAQQIDDEVRSMIEAQYARAFETLEKQRSNLEGLAEALIEKETLEREEIEPFVEQAVSQTSRPTVVAR